MHISLNKMSTEQKVPDINKSEASDKLYLKKQKVQNKKKDIIDTLTENSLTSHEGIKE